eukprot:gene7561-8361_t
MIDNKHLEQRLLLKESVIGASSLARCAVKLSGCKPLGGGTTNWDSKSVDIFLRELSLYRLEIEKSNRSLRSFPSQLKEYEELENSIQKKILSATEEIEELKEKLRQAKEVRTHRKELEDLAIVVNQEQRSSLTKRKISEITESILSVKDTKKKVDNEILTRFSQVEKLMTMIEELEMKLGGEEDGGIDGEEERDREDDRGGGDKGTGGDGGVAEANGNGGGGGGEDGEIVAEDTMSLDEEGLLLEDGKEAGEV